MALLAACPPSPSIALHRVIKAAAPKKVFPSAPPPPPPGRGRVCESDTRQMDLNGDFPAGADVVSTGRAGGGGGRARAFRHALKRQRRTTLAPCGGGDRANFQLQSISMTPDGRAGWTDGRDGGFGGNYRQIMDETSERDDAAEICWFSGTASRCLRFHGIAASVILTP